MERDILFKLIASLTLCDHMGDVAGDVANALEAMGRDDLADFDDLDDLGTKLAREGVTTLYGTSLAAE